MNTFYFSIPPLDTHTPSDSQPRYLITDTSSLLFSGEKHLFCSLPEDLTQMLKPPIFLGSSPDWNWYLAALTTGTLPDGYHLRPLRSLQGIIPDENLALAGRAVQLARFDQTTRFCGVCGAKNRIKEDELAKICPECGMIVFPRLSPAIIVRITDGSRILLARSPHFPGNMHSVIAGFVEPGESLENAVRREVREEVGIEITDPAYFGSQPWPFPDSLMLGFTAEYKSGEIHVDGVEIAEAGWFTPDTMPDLPGRLSISYALIQDYLQNQG